MTFKNTTSYTYKVSDIVFCNTVLKEAGIQVTEDTPQFQIEDTIPEEMA